MSGLFDRLLRMLRPSPQPHPYERIRSFLSETMGDVVSRPGARIEEMGCSPHLNGGAGHVVLHVDGVRVNAVLDRGQFLLAVINPETKHGELWPEFWASVLEADCPLMQPESDSVPTGPAYWKSHAQWLAQHFDRVVDYLDETDSAKLKSDVESYFADLKAKRGF